MKGVVTGVVKSFLKFWQYNLTTILQIVNELVLHDKNLEI